MTQNTSFQKHKTPFLIFGNSYFPLVVFQNYRSSITVYKYELFLNFKKVSSKASMTKFLVDWQYRNTSFSILVNEFLGRFLCTIETNTRNKKLVFSSFVSPISRTFTSFQKDKTPKLVFCPTYKEWPYEFSSRLTPAFCRLLCSPQIVSLTSQDGGTTKLHLELLLSTLLPLLTML